jgi:hypothetical protein
MSGFRLTASFRKEKVIELKTQSNAKLSSQKYI